MSREAPAEVPGGLLSQVIPLDIRNHSRTAVLGQVLGNYLIDIVSWRAAFLVNVPLAIIVLLKVFRYVPESRTEDARTLDLPGALLVTVGLGGVVYGLIGASNQSLVTFVMGRWAGELVTRYGEKLPLTVGPAFAAAGFILFALPGIEGSYWTTYFPAVVVLGFGMSLVFAPLSIAVLNAVEEEHSGLGSGVNRAVQRTAKVLGLAVLAFLELAAFENSLDARVNGLDLTSGQEAALRAEKVDLGATHILGKGTSGGDSAAIDRAVSHAFLSAFRFAMYISAGMAVASAIATALLIQRKKGKEPGRSGPHAGG